LTSKKPPGYAGVGGEQEASRSWFRGPACLLLVQPFRIPERREGPLNRGNGDVVFLFSVD
jgi:hypothetical protein